MREILRFAQNDIESHTQAACNDSGRYPPPCLRSCPVRPTQVPHVRPLSRLRERGLGG